jgi:hypothetical protein
MTQRKKVSYVRKVAKSLHRYIPASQIPAFGHKGTAGDRKPQKEPPQLDR